jgi:hypothetical protein
LFDFWFESGVCIIQFIRRISNMREIVSRTVLSFVMLFALTLLTTVFMGCESPSGGPTALSGTVTITGTTQVEEVLTAVTTALGGSGDISYKWQRGDSVDGSFTDIDGATVSTYTLAAADLGKHIRVTVSRADNTGAVNSAAVGPVTAGGPTALSGTVTITGTTQVEEVLTAVTTALGGSGAISYRWQRGNSAAETFADIDGATASTYTLVAADLDKYIRVTVSRADNTGTVSSAAVGPVAAIPPGQAVITIGFNYGDITITGSDGINVMYKSAARTPNSITLSATGYTGVKWYIDGDSVPAGSENSITLSAADYSAKAHSITFTGTIGGALYSQELPFTVKN